MSQILDTDYKEYRVGDAVRSVKPVDTPSVNEVDTLSVNEVEPTPKQAEQPSTEVEDKCGLSRDNRVFTHLSLTTPYMDNSPCRCLTWAASHRVVGGGGLSPDSVEGCLSPGWCITGVTVGRWRGTAQQPSSLHSEGQQPHTVSIPLYKDSQPTLLSPAHLTLYRNPIHLSLSVFK